MLTHIFIFASLGSLAIASPSLSPRQSGATIKQTVGTWAFKGCYKDFGPRILTFRFDVPAGNNAERCTDLCAAQGYGLAGLEYGSECWCDNYMPYGSLMPNSDCNFPCPGDATELCGAGNRMVVYQNSAATPPSTSSCINWRDSWTFGNTIMYATPRTLGGAGPTTRLYTIPTNPFTDPTFYSIVSTCPAGCVYSDYYNFGLYNGVLFSYNNKVLPPTIGESISFVNEYPPAYNGYNQFCAKPNPISPNGPFIGYPLLSLNGNTDLWGLCANTTANGRLDIVYSPVENHPHYVKSQCQDVYIQITPYAS